MYELFRRNPFCQVDSHCAGGLDRRSLLLGILLCSAAVPLPSPAAGQGPDLNEAFALYRKRRDIDPGLSGTRTAIDIGRAVLASNPGPELVLDSLILLAAAESFVGLVGKDPADAKRDLFKNAAARADRILVQSFGITWTDAAADIVSKLKSQRTDAELDVVSLGLVLSVTSVAGFGDASGVVTALGLIPDIRKRIGVFTALGRSEKFYFVPEAVDAAIYYRVPGLMGGDLSRSVKMFKTIISKTKAPNIDCSVNGLANYFGCQAFNDDGDETAAKALAKAFIMAPLTSFPVESRPENEFYQRLTRDVLQTF